MFVKKNDLEIKRYQQDIDEPELMQMIKDEEGWDYADDKMAERYKFALGNSITFVAYQTMFYVAIPGRWMIAASIFMCAICW